MKAFSTICAFVLLAIGVQLQAEEPNALQKYTITLDRVEFQPDATYFYLSNGTVYSNALLPIENELLKMWNPGDHVDSVVMEEVFESLRLINLEAQIMYLPQVALESFEHLPTIEKIEKVRDLEYHMLKDFDRVLELSDGSSWVSSYDDDFNTWKVGDHINISYVSNGRDGDSAVGSVKLSNYDLIQAKNYDSSYDTFEPKISTQDFPTIKKIERNYSTVYLTLSDGSRWKSRVYDKEDEQKFEVWFVGDKVIYEKDDPAFCAITNYCIIARDIEAEATIYFERIE